MSWVWLPSAQKGETRGRLGWGGGSVEAGPGQWLPCSPQKPLPCSTDSVVFPLAQTAGGTASPPPPTPPSQEPVCLALPVQGIQARKCPVGCFLYTFRECKHWGQASLCDIGQVALPLCAALFSPGQGLTSLTLKSCGFRWRMCV